jgi:hypothetical protein
MLKALLTSSIAAMHSTYGLPAPPIRNQEMVGPLPPGARLVSGGSK